jgi:[ribosomal protein S5]-alanine N-acetyltransferase
VADHEPDESNRTAPDITLRPIDIDDWAAVHVWASTLEACQYQAWGPNTVAETKAFVAQAVSQWSHQPQDRYIWIAEDRGIVVGIGELTIPSRRWRQGELGYAVHVDHWRQGLGTAIGRSLLAIAFDSMDLHRVMATCDPRNLASVAVLRKIGMTFEGRLRHTMEIRDGWRDSNIFSILADEWHAQLN